MTFSFAANFHALHVWFLGSSKRGWWIHRERCSMSTRWLSAEPWCQLLVSAWSTLWGFWLEALMSFINLSEHELKICQIMLQLSFLLYPCNFKLKSKTSRTSYSLFFYPKCTLQFQVEIHFIFRYCETEDDRGWDYCCRPEHRCGYSDGFRYTQLSWKMEKNFSWT